MKFSDMENRALILRIYYFKCKAFVKQMVERKIKPVEEILKCPLWL